MGRFTDWQPVYADAGVPTFPVRDKRPAVSNYLKLRSRGSGQLAAKPSFADDDAFGFVCGRASGLTVLDVDTPDENTLADALDRNGPTPVIVRSQSGNWQAWYRYGGERRQIRPDKSKPIDVLGDGGFCCAPPSLGAKGDYQMVQGSLADLASLPRMRRSILSLMADAGDAMAAAAARPDTVNAGERNDKAYRYFLRVAPQCGSLDDMLAVARQWNAALAEPLPDYELARTAGNAWKKQEDGRNWSGRGRMLPQVHHADFDTLFAESQDGYLLLRYLQRHHSGLRETFVVANAMAESMGWSRKRLAAARAALEALGFLVVMRPANGFAPAQYAFGRAENRPRGELGEAGGGV